VTYQNVPVVINVLKNDYDPDLKSNVPKDSLQILIQPKNGTVEIDERTGLVTYTPKFGFTGSDIFKYKICDDGIPCEPECGEAFVFITVLPLNQPPVALDNFYYINDCNMISNNFVLDDYDDSGDPIFNSIIVPDTVRHGKLTVYPDGTFEYIPNEGYIGIDSFRYEIRDLGDPVYYDTAWVYIDVDCHEETQDPLDCELFIPEGFSPNQDGIHDFFRIMCIHNYPDAKLMIFNRNGDLLWQKQNYGNYDVWGDQYNAWWWGTSVLSKYDVGRQMINGEPKLKVGNYIYVLDLGNGGIKNGTVMISY